MRRTSFSFRQQVPGAKGGRGRGVVAALLTLLVALSGVSTVSVAADPPPPALTVGGLALEGRTLDPAFAADLSNSAGITGDVTWLVDDSDVGVDSSAPYSWAVSTTAGGHKLTARWMSGATTAHVDAYFTVGPYLSAGGVPLEDARVDSPFTANVANSVGITGDVTWLLDDTYVGKDSTAPYAWAVTATAGSHKLKARWVISGTTTAFADAHFTVGKDLRWTPPKTVLETPGPALKNLWATGDNRRAPLGGVYDWSRAGFGGGATLPSDTNVRPEPQCRISAAQMQSDFGVHSDDGVDDTTGLQAAIDQIKAQCSPTGSYLQESRILLPAGTLNVSHELSLDASYLIFRGAGSDPLTGTHFVYAPNAATRYDTITQDGTRWDEDAMTSGDATGGWIWPGRGLFRVQSRQVAQKYLDNGQYAAAPVNRKDLFRGTVNDHWVSGLSLRSKPGDSGYAARKGDTTVYLAASASFDQLEVGGLVNVMAANSVKFYQSMDADHDPSKMVNQHMRQQVFLVTAGDPLGKTITVDKPLEFDLPVDSTSDGSPAIGAAAFASKVTPLVDAIVGVGIESLSFTQAEPNLTKSDATQNYGNMDPAGAMHGIVFKWAANSWVKGVRSDMIGSHPIVTEVAANLSILDNTLNGSWNKGKGGNGYLRGSRVWDSVYAGNTTRDLRHFTFQWSASGNVAIGNSFDSDLNLHGGYERNNLFENNEVSVPYAHRSANCQTNCGEEGGGNPDDSDWYPIWWAAGQKAVKWSGASGVNNVFYNNRLRKQLGNDTTAYTDYAPYGTAPHTIFQFGSGSSGAYHPLDQSGNPISDWAHNEAKDYGSGHGVLSTRSDSGRSLFLKTISLTGYAGPHPQPLRRTWGCKCWDGRGYVNTRLAADPVNTATGSLMEPFIDLSLPGPGVPLTFGRTYNSLDDTDGPFGPGWTFAFNASATPGSGDTVMIRDSTGGQTLYHHEPGGSYTPVDPGVTAVLTDRPGGGWTLTNIDRARIQFNSSGQLTNDTDNQGHGVTASYSNGRLSTVTDTLGQTVALSWGTSGAASGRITGVTASDGRTVSFGYTAAGTTTRLTSAIGVDTKTTTYTYDAATGYLNGITDPLGHTTAQTVYDAATGRVTQQTDATGGVWHFAWNPDTQTATITEPTGALNQDVYAGNVLISQTGADGRSGEVYYDANNLPILQTTAGQQQVRSEYDTRGNLTKQYLPGLAGDAATFDQWTYDSANRTTSHADPAGRTTSYDYDAQGRLTATTLPGGATTTLTYTTLGQVATSTDERGKVTTFAYNAAGDLVRQTSPNAEVTTYSWDSSHNKQSETDPRGNVSGVTPATIEQYTTHWTYDSTGRVLTVTDGLDHTTTNTYDATGNLLTVTAPNGGVTTYTYDNEGRQLTVTDHYNHTSAYTYDAAGRLLSETAADGGKTTHAYNPLGQEVARTDPIGNASGSTTETTRQHTITFVYDAAGNQIQTRVVDPDNTDHDLVTTTTYDAQNRPIAVTDPSGAIATTGYDALGRVISAADPTGVQTTTSFDTAGNIASTTSGAITTTNTFDPAGNLTRARTDSGETTYNYDDDGRLSSVIDRRGNVTGANPADYATTFGYDPAGNRTQVTDPLGHTMRTNYDAANQITKIIDPLNHGISYGHDSMGNVNKVTTAGGALTQYAYNKIGLLSTLTTPLNQAYSYTYDSVGRAKTVTTPEGKVTSYSYNIDGEPTTVTLPSGSITTSYDPLGRVTNTNYSDTSPDITVSYDADSRPRTVASPTASATYTYDEAGRVTEISRGSGQDSTYSYTADGLLSRRAWPDGRSQTYTYGVDKQLSRTTLNPASGATGSDTDYTYDADAHLTAISRTGGPTTNNTYDAAGQLTARSEIIGSTVRQTQAIAYSAAGAPASVTTTRGATSTSDLYGYDTDNRLTSDCRPTSGTTCAAGSPQTTYTYDADNNHLTSNVTGPGAATTTNVYDHDDRLTSSTSGALTTTYTHNNNGQIASRADAGGTTTYAYNLDGNLSGTRLADGATFAYTYDEAGNRLTKTVNGSANTAWTWDTLGEQPTRITQTGLTSTVTDSWWLDPQTPFGSALADDTSTGRSWPLSDFAGSIIATADSDAITSTTRYDPFGQRLAHTGTASPLGFHAQLLDPGSGLYDLRARDYDPSLGRFTAPDPQRPAPDSAFTTSYHYADNTPTTQSDPSGRCLVVCMALGAVAGGGFGAYRCVTKHESCWKDITVGVAVGALAGATLGAVGGSALPGYAAAAADAGIGGAATVLYNGATSYLNDREYSFRQAATDFGAGAATSLVGGLAGKAVAKAAGAVFSRASPRLPTAFDIARNWLKRNTPGPKPADPRTVGCNVGRTGSAAKTSASALDSLSPSVRANVDDAVERAASGKIRFPGHDGKAYNNSDGLLPRGNYTEWTAAEAGAKRGADRVIIEGDPANPNAIYYWDHVNPPVGIGP